MQDERRSGREVDLVSSYIRNHELEYVVGRSNGKTYSNVDVRYVSNDIVLRIENWQGRHTLVIHKLKCVGQRLVSAIYWSVHNILKLSRAKLT